MARFTIDLTDDIDSSLSEISKRRGITKAEAMRRAFALLEVADKAKSRKRKIGVIEDKGDDYRVVSEVIVL